MVVATSTEPCHVMRGRSMLDAAWRSRSSVTGAQILPTRALRGGYLSHTKHAQVVGKRSRVERTILFMFRNWTPLSNFLSSDGGAMMAISVQGERRCPRPNKATHATSLRPSHLDACTTTTHPPSSELSSIGRTLTLKWRPSRNPCYYHPQILSGGFKTIV